MVQYRFNFVLQEIWNVTSPKCISNDECDFTLLHYVLVSHFGSRRLTFEWEQVDYLEPQCYVSIYFIDAGGMKSKINFGRNGSQNIKTDEMALSTLLDVLMILPAYHPLINLCIKNKDPDERQL